MVLKRSAAVLGLIGLAALAAFGVILATHGTPPSGAAGSPPAAPAATSLVPAYGRALARAETAREQQLDGATPATDTRLMASREGRNLYVGRVAGANAICLSVENPQSGRLSTTCGGETAIRAGQLILSVGGEAEDSTIIAGVAGADAAGVRVLTRSGATDTPVSDGFYVARTTERVTGVQFINSAGARVATLSLPGH